MDDARRGNEFVCWVASGVEPRGHPRNSEVGGPDADAVQSPRNFPVVKDGKSVWRESPNQHMDTLGVRQCTPRLRPSDQGMNGKGYIDPDDFAPGYIRRGTPRLPKQGDREPWTNCQDYYQERDTLVEAPFDDGALVFDNRVQKEKVA